MKLLLALLLLVPPQADRAVVLARHGRSLRGTIDGRPLLVLRGSAAERGEAQAVLAGREILRALEAVASTLQARRPGAWDAAMLPGARRFAWPPRFEEELAAMAARLPADPVPALGRRAGIDDLRVMNALSDLLGAGCSSFSAWGDRTPDGQVISARNADYAYFPLLDLLSIVAVVPSEKDLLPTLDVGMPGSIGASTALNAEGAWLALHDEAGLPGPSTAAWIPRALALREAIERARGAQAVEDVAAVLRKSPVRVGNNVHVSGPGIVPAVLEWDGNAKDGGVTVRRGEGTSIVCTNHYVARAAREAGDSRNRYEFLRKGAAGKVDFEAARRLLEGVSRSGGNLTLFSVISWPAARRYAFAIAPNPGTSAPKARWTTVEWAEIFDLPSR